MKLAGTLWRWARLGFFVALGSAAAVVEACGSGATTVRADAELPRADDASSPADGGFHDSAAPDGGIDAKPPLDGAAGWDTPLE